MFSVMKLEGSFGVVSSGVSWVAGVGRFRGGSKEAWVVGVAGVMGLTSDVEADVSGTGSSDKEGFGAPIDLFEATTSHLFLAANCLFSLIKSFFVLRDEEGADDVAVDDGVGVEFFLGNDRHRLLTASRRNAETVTDLRFFFFISLTQIVTSSWNIASLVKEGRPGFCVLASVIRWAVDVLTFGICTQVGTRFLMAYIL